MDAYATLDAALADADTAGFGMAAADGGPGLDRIGVARNRLYCLGYLWKDNQRQSPDAEFITALESFQQEANLALSCRLDEETWLALEQLVGFESNTRIDRWYRNDIALPVLVRAVRLRLAAFGLVDRLSKPSCEKFKQGVQERELQKGLDSFARIARLLRLSDTPLAPDFSKATLRTLFDEDALVERLAGMGRGMTVRHRDGAGREETKEDNTLVIDFVRSIARIELWLAGFATKPRKQFDYDYGGSELGLNQAMPEFWKSQPEPERPRPSERLDISGHFFTRLQQLAREGSEITQQRIAPIVEQVMEDEETAKGVKTEMQALGARLWDGIKRALRWLSSKLTAGIKVVTNRITNLARLVKTTALGLYASVRTLLHACADSIKFILCTRYKLADSAAVLLLRDRDFDLSLIIDNRASHPPVAAFLTEFGLRCRLFAISAHVAGHLAGMIMAISRRMALGGWFGLALALARLSDSAKKIHRLAGTATQILSRIEPALIEAY